MKYFLIAGEASGDLHASRLMKYLLKEDPEAQFKFLGGNKMARYGGEPIVHYKDMAFMGFVNVIMNLGKINEIRKVAEREIMAFRPDHLILVDYPGFNLRFAKFVKKNLPGTVVNYYIAPKLWAWKSWRIEDIKKYVDRMFTIFPFETEWFGERGYKVDYVGNPTVEAINAFRRKGVNEQLFREQNDIDEKPIVLLLAGSRMQEIKKSIPTMVEVAKKFPEVQFILCAAPGIGMDVYDQLVGESGIKVLQNVTYELMTMADAAIVNSGTATLETAVFDVPQVVIYKGFGGRLITLLFTEVLIKTEFVSLVNIIAGREVVKELLGYNYTAESTEMELRKILYNNVYRDYIREGYQQVRDELGDEGGGAVLAKKFRPL